MPEYGLNIGSRRSVNVITPTFDRDFVTYGTLNHGTGPNITFTRASSATVFTSTGILSTVPNNVPRFEWGSFRTNYIRNSTFAGAVAGNPGTVPSNGWSFQDSNKGISYIIKSVGTDSELGLPYIEVQLSGTNTIPDVGSGVAASLAIYPLNSNQLQVLSGQTWTTSVYFKTIAGSLSGNPVVLYNIELGSPNGSSTTLFTPTTNWQRISNTRTMSITSEPRYLRPSFGIATIPLLSSIDYTFRIAAPQTELSSAATAFIPTTNAPVTTGVPLGLLIEESRTNFVGEQNLFSWSQAGIPTLSAGSGIAGLSSFIVNDLRDDYFSQIWYTFPTALLSSTTYVFSCYIRKNLNYNNTYPLLRVYSPDNNVPYAGINFNQATGQAAIQPGYTLTSAVSVQDYNTYYRASFTFNTQSTAVPTQVEIIPSHGYGFGPTLSGTSIEVAGIQVEQGSFPTSYIPTAGLSATRQADDARVSSINTSSFYNQDQGTIFMETQYLPYRFTSSTSPGLWTLDTGVFAQGYGLFYAGDTTRLQLYTRNTGNTITYIDTSPYTTPQLTRSAAVISPTFRNLFFNGIPASTQGIGANTTPYVLPPITTFRIGANYIAGTPSVNFFGGYLRKVTYWPSRLSNNRLRTLTLSA